MEDVRRKRLLFRAWRRGTQEMDLLLGPFCESHLTGMSAAELDALEAILDAPEPDLYAYLVRRGPAPAGLDRDLLGRIRAEAERR